MGWMDEVPLWDHHCHALVAEGARADLERLVRALTEAPSDYPLDDLMNTVVVQEAMGIAARYFRVDATLGALASAFEGADYRAYCRELLRAAGYARLYVDTGYTPDNAWPLTTLSEVLEVPVYPILRLETTAQDCLMTSPSFDDWRDEVLATVGRAHQDGFYGVKSIVAYRSGLQLYRVREDEARGAWEAMRRRGASRLTDPVLLNYLLYLVTPVLIKEGLVLQFHTGLGDPDTDLIKGNPLWLRNYLEEFSRQGHRVALLHTYPYQREAAYLTSVYPGVYADVSLAVPLTAFGAERILHELLELAPVSRVLFASDAHTRPESYVLAAQFFRQGFSQFLSDVVAHHHVLPSVAEDWAARVSYRNAESLYAPEI
ncbi:MAG: amidohydrolase family protein [Firmicutes bacterium]|nr:amidohydrolase family protein [Bacillota bacterium]